VLQQLGVIKPGKTPVAATSGGAIGCALDFGIVDHDDFLKAGKDFVSRCRDKHNCAGTLGSEVSRVVDKILPPNAHEIVSAPREGRGLAGARGGARTLRGRGTAKDLRESCCYTVASKGTRAAAGAR
jgi:hypothetical protein